MSPRSLPVLAALALALLLPAAACEDGTPATPCVNSVPTGGCPDDGTLDVCQDPSCNAAYACTKGSWVLDHTCPPRPADAGSDAVILPRDAQAASDAAVDAPPGAFGGPGCVDLQPPECPAGVALACGGARDCCGCTDLFVCVNGGWNPWGSCVDGGVVPQ
ncbi:MAG TPA: hypothetical protein VIF15_21875 [Polyangiaceae bacterium]